ncbi:MAG: AAA family ATPase, partial [Xanthomonadales bacterium]|nr:AAA family ATPase [Xanthomonadales bacterium]
TDSYNYEDVLSTFKKSVDAIINDNFNTKNKAKNNKEPINFPLNQILYGPPGTGKTYNTIFEAAKIILNTKYLSYQEARGIFNEQLAAKKEERQIEFITFHQNYSYEDFIQGLRPDVDDTNNGLSFEKKNGVFKSIADRAHANLLESENKKASKLNFESVFNTYFNDLIEGSVEKIEIKMKKSSFYITNISEKSVEFRKQNGVSNHTLSLKTLSKMYEKGVNDIILGGLQPYYNPLLDLLLKQGEIKNTQVEKKNYVIIIDEINRANISRVFGELITLIEPDKRSHGKYPLSCTLPSGEKFIVPSNLYIIGTMNTADKSIALLDIALRRRFEFVPMYPNYALQNGTVHEVEVLKAINDQIKKSKGHDFQIGHSYFMVEEGKGFDLENCMNKKVIPLLLEYFMNDETEVKSILENAKLKIKDNQWPLKIDGNAAK